MLGWRRIPLAQTGGVEVPAAAAVAAVVVGAGGEVKLLRTAVAVAAGQGVGAAATEAVGVRQDGAEAVRVVRKAGGWGRSGW